MSTAALRPEGYSLLREKLVSDLRRFRKTLLDFLRNSLALTGLGIIVFFIAVAVAAPLLVGPYPSILNLAKPFQGPSAAHPLGTDWQGYDILALLVYGGRVSLLIGFAASIVAMLVGTAVGLVAGYYGGGVDQILSRATDFFLVIPWLPFALIIVAILTPGLYTIILAVAVVSWPTTARVIRSQVLTVRERAYIRRARAIGAGNGHIIVKHVLPNVMPLVWAEAVLTVSGAIFTEAFLSFFGLGWTGPTAIESWGQMVNFAYTNLAMQYGWWWWWLPAGLCITLLVLGFAMMGYGLEEVFNPRYRRR